MASLTEQGISYPGDGVTVEGHLVSSGITEHGRKILSIDMTASGSVAADFTLVGDRDVIRTRSDDIQLGLNVAIDTYRILDLIRDYMPQLGMNVGGASDSEKQEYCSDGYQSTTTAYGALWRAQTFTPSVSHTVTKAVLMIWRTLNCGTVTVTINTCTGNNPAVDKPTQTILCTGAILQSEISEVAFSEWEEADFGSGASLDAGTMYAIVISAPSGDSGNCVNWGYDSTGTYTNGCRAASSNSGVDWTLYTSADCMFEEWGYTGVAYLSERVLTLTRNATQLIGLVATGVKSILRTLSGSVALGLYSPVINLQGFPYTFPFMFYSDWGSHRTLDLTRDLSQTLGLTTVYSRVIDIARNASQLLGLSGTASRVVEYIRGQSQYLGLLTSSDMWREWTKAGTIALGLLATATHSALITMSGTVLLGLLPAAARTIDTGRDYIQYLGLNIATGNRVVARIRTATQQLGLLLTETRTLVLGRSYNIALGLLQTATHAAFYDFVGTQSVGFVTSMVTGALSTMETGSMVLSNLSEVGDYVIDYISEIGEKSTEEIAAGGGVQSSRTLILLRSMTETLRLGSTSTKVMEAVRNGIIQLGLLVSGSHTTGYIMLGTIELGLAPVASRISDAGRLSLSYLGLLTSSSRLSEFNRSSDTMLTMSPLYERIAELYRVTTQYLGLASTGSKLYEYIKSATTQLGLLLSGNRLLELIRDTTINLGLLGVGDYAIGRLYQYLGSVMLGLTTVSSRALDITRDYSTNLGLTTTGDRIIEAIRDYLVQLGLLTSATRTAVYTRINTALLGLLASAEYTYNVIITRIGTSIVAFIPTGDRILTALRSRTTYLGLLQSGDRTLVMIRDYLATLRLGEYGAKVVNRIKTGIQYLGLASSSLRSLVFIRLNTIYLGLSANASKTIGLITEYVREGLTQLGLLASATALKDRLKSGTIALGLVGTSNRYLVMILDGTIQLGLVGTPQKVIAITVSTIQQLGLLVSSDRHRVFIRSDVELLGLLATGTKYRVYDQVELVALGLAPTASRALILGRSATLQLGLLASSVSSAFTRLLMKLTSIHRQPYSIKSSVKPAMTIQSSSNEAYDIRISHND